METNRTASSKALSYEIDANMVQSYNCTNHPSHKQQNDQKLSLILQFRTQPKNDTITIQLNILKKTIKLLPFDTVILKSYRESS
jgi:hypothetical protein